MELGNIIFGNARGQHEIPRHTGWEDALFELFDAINPGGDDFYGIDYENDSFRIMPYYSGECTCGWDDVDNGHEMLEALEHRDYCYQKDFKALERKLKKRYKLMSKIYRRAQEQGVKRLYKKHGLEPIDGDYMRGCAVRCTCDFSSRENSILQQYAALFGRLGHKNDCRLMLDNFHYKPMGFGIQWYKYPMRDAYMNQNITLIEFQSIIAKCKKSINHKNG